MKPQELARLDSTMERNEAYCRNAPDLAAKCALKAIQSWGGKKQDITHVISVSCTGSIVPGLEFRLVDDLGLNRNVIRLGVNFIGCFGGLAGKTETKYKQIKLFSDPFFQDFEPPNLLQFPILLSEFCWYVPSFALCIYKRKI